MLQKRGVVLLQDGKLIVETCSRPYGPEMTARLVPKCLGAATSINGSSYLDLSPLQEAAIDLHSNLTLTYESAKLTQSYSTA